MQVRLIGADGEQVGVISLQEALAYAEEAGFDLVEIAPQAKPPVCKVIDYGKFRYEQTKKEKDARKKQHTVQIKGIRLTPNINKHDFEFKLDAARRFIMSGSKIKVSMLFKGRLITHKEFGEKILNDFKEKISDIAKIESEARMEGAHNMVIIFTKK